jgi:hypothetical protein
MDFFTEKMLESNYKFAVGAMVTVIYVTNGTDV